MIVIGITGASGSGKTTVVNLLDFKIIDADKLARKAVEKGSLCLKQLVKGFGRDILNDDGTLNRKVLSKKAFADKEQTMLLNSITHPAIVKLIEAEIDFYQKSGEKAVILDAPQLFEAGCEKYCDKIIGVIADENIRKRRIILRDNIDEALAAARINAGKKNKFFIDNCDYIIKNNGDILNLELQINEIISSLEL